MKQMQKQVSNEIEFESEEEETEECYDCHEYEYIERLECISGEYVRELWGCADQGQQEIEDNNKKKKKKIFDNVVDYNDQLIIVC
jgi:hypothetical protein